MFYHDLRRSEHQHAMDIVARLRRDDDENASSDGDNGVSTLMTGPFPSAGEQSALPVTIFRRRSLRRSGSTVGTGWRSFSDSDDGTPFSPAVVASSSVSFLEILQFLTLQVHALEERASLHHTQPELDEESKSLSSGLSINSYLSRLIISDRPLPSRGSGTSRASILGLLVALHEHGSDHGGGEDSDGLSDSAHANKTTVAPELCLLVDYNGCIGLSMPLLLEHQEQEFAAKSTPSGIPYGIRDTNGMALSRSDWTLDPEIRSTVSGTLSKLHDLWPKASEGIHPEGLP